MCRRPPPMIGPLPWGRKAGSSLSFKGPRASAGGLTRSSPFAVARCGPPEPFRGPRDGLDVAVIDGGNYQIGPVGQFVYSQRDKADSPAVRSLGNVPWAGEVGIFAQYWWVPWLRTRTEVRQGFHGHHGIVADIMTDAVVPVSPQWTLSGCAGVTPAPS